jgi:hypothetical protein
MAGVYGVVVFLHVLGAFAFVLAHGVSMFVSFRLRTERDAARRVLLFELSCTGINLMYLGLVVLLVAGIAAGFLGNHWGRLWIWAALGTLVVVLAVMYSVATPFYGRMRAAAGAPVPDQVVARMKPPPAPEDLDRLATSNRPFWLAAVGGTGLVVLIWLMLAKPF